MIDPVSAKWFIDQGYWVLEEENDRGETLYFIAFPLRKV